MLKLEKYDTTNPFELKGSESFYLEVGITSVNSDSGNDLKRN